MPEHSLIASFSLAWPWALLLVPVPLLMRWLLPARPAPEPALRLPFVRHLPETVVSRRHARTRPHGIPWAGALLWLLLVGALTQPYLLDRPAPVAAEGREFIVALDLSGSMLVADMGDEDNRVTRLDAASEALMNLLDSRHGDRVGLIVFGTYAHWLAPPTFDTAALQQLLGELFAGLAGERTAIGDAIGLALKGMESGPASERVLVLMTDGRNTAGTVSSIPAAEFARSRGMRIHTVGIGRAGSGAAQGEASGLDVAALQDIAAATGGRYWAANEAGALAAVVEELGRVEPVVWSRTLGHRRVLYPWLLFAALALALGLAVMPTVTLPRQRQGEDQRRPRPRAAGV